MQLWPAWLSSGMPQPKALLLRCQFIQVILFNTGSKTPHTSTILPIPFPMFYTVHLKLSFVPELISWLISFTATPTPIAIATASTSATGMCVCASWALTSEPPLLF